MEKKIRLPKISEVFANKWFIIFVSIFNGIYTAGLIALAVCSVFYKIDYYNEIMFAVLYSLISAVFSLLLFYTRKSFLTNIFATINIIVFLPTMLMLWGEWVLIVPAAIVALFGFAVCSINETFKVVLGTVFLLVYIVSGIAVYLIANIFSVVTVDTLIEEGVSPSGYFRWETYNIENKSSGKTAVFIEPNKLDFDVAGVLHFKTTMKKMIKQGNNPTVMATEWNNDKLYINGEEYFNEIDYIDGFGATPVYNFEEGNWVHTHFDMDYPIFEDISHYWDILVENIEKLLGTAEEAPAQE